MSLPQKKLKMASSENDDYKMNRGKQPPTTGNPSNLIYNVPTSNPFKKLDIIEDRMDAEEEPTAKPKKKPPPIIVAEI